MNGVCSRRGARGFSLIELMVALTTGLLVAAVIATMFASNARTYAVTSSIGELQDAGRNAFELLQRDVRMAGYQGCDSSGGTAAPLVELAAARTDDAAAPVGASSADGDSNGDSLTLRVPVGESMVLASPMDSADAPLAVGSLRGVAVNDRLLIADCSAAAVFRVTGLGNGVIEHNDKLNRGSALPRAFGADALLLRVETHRYFIAPASRGSAEQRALWLQVDAGAPTEVATNVQDMRLQFGIDTDGDGVPNRFVRTSGMATADWPHVTAVQLELLLRGALAGRSAASASYVYDGRTVTPTDGRMYRVYSATLPLRNRQS